MTLKLACLSSKFWALKDFKDFLLAIGKVCIFTLKSICLSTISSTYISFFSIFTASPGVIKGEKSITYWDLLFSRIKLQLVIIFVKLFLTCNSNLSLHIWRRMLVCNKIFLFSYDYGSNKNFVSKWFSIIRALSHFPCWIRKESCNVFP